MAAADSLQHQLQGTTAEPRATARTTNGARSTCSSATQRSIRILGPQMNIPDDAFDKIMGANVRSNHWLCQLVLPEMVERKDGSIIIVSSIGGMKGSPLIGAYCISKAADFQLARNIAVEYGPHNVRANCIAPGLIKTDFARALWEDPETAGVLDAQCAAAPHRPSRMRLRVPRCSSRQRPAPS